MKTLVRFAEEHQNGKKLLLVPCGDNYIKLLVRNQDALRDYYTFSCIDEPLLMQLSIKENFYKVCTDHGFLFPQTTTCSAENYKDIVLPFDFPVIIKPSNSVAYWNCTFPHKKKVFLANNKEEFDAILEAIYGSSYQDHLILQEYIPGEDSQMRVMNCYCGKDKKVKLIALGHALLEEQSPRGDRLLRRHHQHRRPAAGKPDAGIPRGHRLCGVCQLRHEARPPGRQVQAV